MNDEAQREALAHLTATDTALVAAAGRRRSLDPRRPWATSLRALGEILLTANQPPRFAETFATTVSAIARSQLRCFPDNIFWDLDALVAALVHGAMSSDDPCATLIRRGGLIVALYQQYGVESPIRFRYAHDFVYGWDWAKWVAKAPEARAAVGPFDEPLLDALEVRGNELLTLIEQGDERYPALAPTEMRNPFGFSREPEHEAVLMESLAAQSKVPVEAWHLDPKLIWNRPYAKLRRDEAERLGLARRRPPSPGG